MNNETKQLRFIDKANKVHNNLYNYSKVIYKDSHSKVCIIDPDYGEFWQSPTGHLSGQNHPQRAKKISLIKIRETKDDFVRKAKEVHGDLYDYSKVYYINQNTNVCIIDPDYGEFYQRPAHHLNGHGNPKRSKKTSSNKRKSNSYKFIQKCKEIHGDKYDYSLVKYINNHENVKIICPSHGLFLQAPHNHLQGKGCKQCCYRKNAKKFSKTTEQFIEDSIIIHKNKYDYSLVDYINAYTDVKIICPTHGEFSQIPINHMRGANCPKCSLKSSQYEEWVKSYLDKNNIKYDQNNRDLISPLELDFYLPDQKIAIEVNGVYWHSELQGKDKNYHLNKTNQCNEKGIRLIHILDHEIKNNPKIIESLLNSIFNKNKYPIYARNCEIKEIDYNTKSEFLEKYHLQGNDSSSIKLGLFYKDRLVSVMTFRKQLQKEKGYYELSRLCGNNSFYIIGGASKLLKYFEKNYKPIQIKTFADKRWSLGNVYDKLGFQHTHDSSPNYWYFNDNFQLYHRFNFRKSELLKKLEKFDPNLTEWENMVNNGWNRIWDCGNMVFSKRFS